MFQYTSETIINSNKGKLAGNVRFGIYPATPNESDAPITENVTDCDFLLIDGVNSFLIGNIKKIYRAPYRAEKKATAQIALGSVAATDLVAGDIVRLTVVLSEIGSVRSALQNAYLHKSKPFHYEITVPEQGSYASVAEALVAALVKLINKDMAMTDFDYFKAAVDTTKSTLDLTADDCYIQFKDVKLQKVLDITDDATPLAAKLLGENCVADIDKVTVVKTAGDEGAGTVARLVKNLRIPTNASINPFGADQGGRPVPGGEYAQYVIEYETQRNQVSGVVMGSVGEVSRTTHVVFINTANDDLKTDWEAVITLVAAKANAGAGITVIPSGKPNGDTVANRTMDKDGAVDTVTYTAASGTDPEKVELEAKKPEIGNVE